MRCPELEERTAIFMREQQHLLKWGSNPHHCSKTLTSSFNDCSVWDNMIAFT